MSKVFHLIPNLVTHNLVHALLQIFVTMFYIGETTIKLQIIIVEFNTEVHLREGDGNASDIQHVEVADATDELCQNNTTKRGVDVSVLIDDFNHRVVYHYTSNVVPLLRMVLLKDIEQFITDNILSDMKGECQFITITDIGHKPIGIDKGKGSILENADSLVGILDVPVVRILL